MAFYFFVRCKYFHMFYNKLETRPNEAPDYNLSTSHRLVCWTRSQKRNRNLLDFMVSMSSFPFFTCIERSTCSHFVVLILNYRHCLVTALFVNLLISIPHSFSDFTNALSLAVIHSLSLNFSFVCLDTNKFSFFSRNIGPWNNLTLTTVTSGSLPAFKFKLKYPPVVWFHCIPQWNY